MSTRRNQATPTSRLRQARLAAGLSLDDTVEKLEAAGISFSKAALSNYELGKRTPNAEALIRLAKVLDVTPGFLLSEPTCEIAWAAFRCKSGLTKAEEYEVKARASIAGEHFVYMRQVLFPKAQSQFPARAKASTAEAAEERADRLRSEWDLGMAPIESVVESVESHDAFALAHRGMRTAFDGLSGWINDSIPLMVVNADVAVDRKRFDLAHELGHLLLDAGHLPAKEEETIAHRFAAAFLVPAAVAKKELGDRRRSVSFAELAVLKRKYGLSMAAWMRRAFDLGIISPSSYKYMCIDFSKRGWRKKEPVDYAGSEEPTSLKQMALRALSEGAITPDEADQIMPGVTEESEVMAAEPTSLLRSATELLKLPKAERDQIMARAASMVQADYEGDPALTDFEAFGEEDLHE